jgi:hypothetical protein
VTDIEKKTRFPIEYSVLPLFAEPELERIAAAAATSVVALPQAA